MKSLSHVQLFCDPMDCSLPGSSVHGIFQARLLEWGAIAFSVLLHSYLLNYKFQSQIILYFCFVFAMQAPPIAISLGYPEAPPVSKLPPIPCPLTVTLQGGVLAALQAHLSPLHLLIHSSRAFSSSLTMLASLSSAQITVTTTLINVCSSFPSQLGCHFPQEDLPDCSLPRTVLSLEPVL